MEKTISYLNSKIWYRIIKVLCIFVFLISFVGFNIFVFGEVGFENIDSDKTKISCNYKDKKTFSPSDEKISLNNNDFKNKTFDYKSYFEGYNDYNIKNILKVCYDKDVDDVFAMQRWYEKGLQDKSFISDKEMQEIEKIESSIISSDKAKYLDYSFKFFNIDPVFSYSKFIKYFLIGNIAILLLFELIRRVFYYIALGTLKPKK